MKKLIAFYLFGSLLITSCDSDPAPQPTPEPGVDIPGEAVLILPVNNKECEQGEVDGNSAVVEFSWDGSENTDAYDVRVTNLDTQTNTMKTGITTTSTELSLERGHAYSWQVTSKNSGSVSTNSETWKFYLAGDGESNFAPFPVEAIYPTSGATITPDDGKVTLEWEISQDPDGDNVTYTLYADKVDALQTPSADWQNITENSMEINVETNTVYYWRIVTSDGNNTATSNVFNFKTKE